MVSIICFYGNLTVSPILVKILIFHSREAEIDYFNAPSGSGVPVWTGMLID